MIHQPQEFSAVVAAFLGRPAVRRLRHGATEERRIRYGEPTARGSQNVGGAQDGSQSGLEEDGMPEKRTIERAKEAEREGRSPTTQAGEFVREEIHHVREGKHGARSTKQAVAIGLSKARRAGVKLPPPAKGKASEDTRRRAALDVSRGRSRASAKPSPKRSRAVRDALQREGRSATSPAALAKQARSSARRRTGAERSAAARKAARTKGPAVRAAAAKKAARTRTA